MTWALLTLIVATFVHHHETIRVKGRPDESLVVEAWGGRASVESVGYRMVWEFRLRTVQAVLSGLTARCRAADPEFRLIHLHTLEEPAWALVSQRPLHLLDPTYWSWDALLLAIIWVQGRPTPLLPGPAIATLVLNPRL